MNFGGKKTRKIHFVPLTSLSCVCVCVCVHIHAQICMFTLHSQCVKYSMCVQCVCELYEHLHREKNGIDLFFVSFEHYSLCQPVDIFVSFHGLVQMKSLLFRSKPAPCSLTVFTVANCCCCRENYKKKTLKKPSVILIIYKFLLELDIYNLCDT